MRVRILSGNLAGQVVVMDRTEAEVNIATGFVELVAEIPLSALVGLSYIERPKTSVTSRHWRSKADRDDR